MEVATIKPLDVAGISEVLGKCGCAVSIEDHNVIGGLGSAIAEVIAEHAPATLARLGLQDRYGESGHPDELLDAYGMSTANIAETAKALVARKKQGLRRFRTEQA